MTYTFQITGGFIGERELKKQEKKEERKEEK